MSSSKSESETVKQDNSETASIRTQPIPPPNNPRQYRAIGLIEGRYIPSEDQLTRGVLITPDGSIIEAVLLGRLLSLVKNHIDKEKNHLWVVYPRTKQENDNLHIQMVGIWEPETLSHLDSEELETQIKKDKTCQSGYFSIRGEVIYHIEETETVIVKIVQSVKDESKTTKFFKLKLKGTLPGKPLRHFWDLDVQLQGDRLVIQEGKDIGPTSFQKKKPYGKDKKFSGKPQKNRDQDELNKEGATSENKTSSPAKIVKRVKKSES